MRRRCKAAIDQKITSLRSLGKATFNSYMQLPISKLFMHIYFINICFILVPVGIFIFHVVNF